MDTNNFMHNEPSRMEIFGLLSECYRLPDVKLLEKTHQLEMLMGDISTPAASAVRQIREALESNPDVEQLKIEYSRLFVGPYTLLVPPYGSVYLDGERKMMGDSTLDVIERYREAGLQTSADFKDAPDHISVELEFMYYLIFKEIEAFSGSELQNAIGFVQRQNHFLADHLMAWVPEFVAGINKHAETPFYPSLAGATAAFLEDSHRRVCTFLEAAQTNLKGTAPGSFEAIAGLVGKYQIVSIG